MTESGQPGAATPGEHGDGTGQQDDLARSVSGWAPPVTGWSRSAEGGRDALPSWRQPDTGWGASSRRHGDLPDPLPGRPAEEPPARVNGRPHLNGVHHADHEQPIARQTPVSAPPGSGEEPPRESADRLVVPAQRSAPVVERSAAEAEPGPARHASDEPPAPRASRRADPGVPSSAPPALQVPPVGAAASGFEVPPGFHAPTVDRPAAEPPLARSWADRFPPEQPAAEPPAETPRASAGPAGPSGDAGSAEEPEWSGPNWNQPSWGGWAPPWSREEQPVGRRARDERGSGWAPEPTPPQEPLPAEQTRSYEPQRAEPTPPYEAYGEVRPEPRPAYEPEPRPAYGSERGSGYGSEPRPAYGPVARESVERPAWGGGAPLGTPFSAPPTSASPSAPPTSALPPAAPTSAPPGPRGAPAPAHPTPTGAPSAVAPPPGLLPTGVPPVSAPPLPDGPPVPSYPPPPRDPAPVAVVRSAEEDRPFRLRPVVETTPASVDPSGDVSPRVPGIAAAGDPAARVASTGPSRADRSAAGGPSRADRSAAGPAPTSAPPYAARRSVPEPAPTEPEAAGPAESTPPVLPQRVPAEPDVPVVPEPPVVEPSAETPELARIATHLRRDDEPAPLRERPEGFDVNAILDAVREVAGVRDAALRRTPAGAHSLRLDLADGADPAEVSRQVARLLQDRMGLAAAPQNLPGMPASAPPPVRRRSAEPRAGENRARENRLGENRVGENRLGALRDTEGRRARDARPEVVPSPRESPASSRPEFEPPRRRRPAPTHRGRATVEENSLAAAPTGAASGSPATLGTSYSGGQVTTTETAPSRPLDTGGVPGPRVVIDHVQVSTFGLDATVEVRLIAGDETAEGHSTGPAVDGYVLRLCAVAAAAAVDELLRGAPQASDRGRCFVEHTAVVPFGNCEVATVVALLVCDGWVEQLAGSALVAGDPRQAVVRATLAAVNRRLEALLA
ncbi:hypothetical protein ACFO0M_08800 [Micromonospora mangrovi]|uniref:Uncharacterized protein n=2 Tax=Micromonospora TaxID=1873 RepID=A0AAU8HBD9_9ACTN